MLASPAAGQELAAFYARQAKHAQLFLIQPGRDTVLRAAEGTMVLVPANAFVNATDQVPVDGPVELRIREFYSLNDMVLNNLSTRAGEQLLETGGMLQLEASRTSGQLCALREGVQLLLRMPTTRPQPDMQLFKGVHNATSKQLDWQAPKAQVIVGLMKSTDIQPPKFVGGSGVLRQQLRKGIVYTSTLRRQLKAMRLSKPGRHELRRLSHNLGQPVLAVMHVRITIAENGQVLTPEAQGGVYSSELQAEVLSAVRALPRWSPARWQGVATPSTCIITARFTANGKILVDYYYDKLETIRQLEAADFVQAFERQFTSSTLSQASTGGISNYLFSAAQLGWINCDRFINSSEPLITFAVSEDDANMDIKLVFKNKRSVLAGEKYGAQTKFRSVPQNEPVTIVAIKQRDGTTYLASQETTLSDRTEENLAFRPVSMIELKEEIARLEKK